MDISEKHEEIMEEDLGEEMEEITGTEITKKPRIETSEMADVMEQVLDGEPEFMEPELDDEESSAASEFHSMGLIQRAAKLAGVRTTKDIATGQERTYVVPGTEVYEKMIARRDMEHGLAPEGSEARERERENVVKQLMSTYYIRVPATHEEIANPKISGNLEEHEVEPGGPKIPTMMVIPDANNPLHVELLWKQKGIRLYDQTMEEGTDRPGVVSVKEAMTGHGRNPYRLSREELVRTFEIKSPMTLAVSPEALNQAIEFYAANVHEQLRESSLIPTVVPTPWLIFVYDSSPKGLAMNSYTLISKYMMIYRALETKIKNVSQASRSTIDLCRLASYGKLGEYPGEPPAYTKWTREEVIKYIIAWQEAQSRGKKARREVNLSFGMNPKKMLCWAFFTRAVASRVLTDAYYSSIVHLVRMCASEMNLEGLITIEGDHQEGVRDSGISGISGKEETRVDKYETVMYKVSTNPKFLRNLFKLHCEYMYAYIRTLEDFLLFLSFEHIPLRHWDSLIMPPLVDPAFPPGVYVDEAHEAIASAMSVLENKTLMGCINEIREQIKDVQIQHLLRMKEIESEEATMINDESERLYGEGAMCAPTFFEMKLYCKWLVFATQETDHETERNERDRLLVDNIRKRIEFAQSMGRKVILHTRDGETMEAERKSTGKRGTR